MTKQSTLITLTAPSAAGKSYLFNYIRDVAKLPCLISTTTRSARAGEIEGVDYYFISEEKSIQMEQDGLFAELAIYRGVRYGVTKEEFASKLSKGIAFLIVEPSGIDHYVKPALDAGAIHKKYFISTSLNNRLSRLCTRFVADLSLVTDIASTQKITSSFRDRLDAATTDELDWEKMHKWDLILSGHDSPNANLQLILSDSNTILTR